MGAPDPTVGDSANPDNATSMTLIDRIRDNDQDAWRHTHYLYMPLVVYWCRRRGVDAEDAQDVAQEVFRAIAAGVGSFRRDRPEDTFRGWLRAIAHHKALDWHRQQGKQPARAVGGTEAALFLGAVPGESDHDDDPGQLSELYRRALDLVRGEFEANTWTSFWRVAVDGLAVADVARDLGLSDAAVRKNKSRVLRRLRQVIGDIID